MYTQLKHFYCTNNKYKRNNMEFRAIGLFTQVESAKLKFDEYSILPTCCQMFSNKAIPCSHLISFITCKGMTQIPEDLICNRWKLSERKLMVERGSTLVSEGNDLRLVFSRCENLVAERSDIQRPLI